MNTDKRSLVFHLRSSVFICGSFLFAFSIISGCERAAERKVVLYTSIDQPVAAGIVADFEKTTGIKVVLVTDTEATKSVGLAERLRAERSNPQADVWWGNEPFHTINLANEGLLAEYESPSAKDVGARYKDPKHRWAGSGRRVRVIAEDAIISPFSAAIELEDLLAEKYRDKVAIARPTAGTTAGHVAALYVVWGDERADAFFRALRGNGVKLLGGNGPVAEAVAARTVRVGLTDNDDVINARAAGSSLEMTLPDQDGIGTLVIPTTVALVAGARSPDAARQLIDYLLSKPVEQRLIDTKFAYGSVRPAVDASDKPMNIDYHEVARKLPDAVRRATAILEGREAKQ